MSRHYFQITEIGKIFRGARLKKGLLLREVSSRTDMDQAILSKIERGARKPTKDQIIRLSKVLDLDQDKMLIEYLSDKIANDIANEPMASKALKVAEKKIKYLKKINEREY